MKDNSLQIAFFSWVGVILEYLLPPSILIPSSAKDSATPFSSRDS